jgi:Ca2+-binding RTX toxin-like protein
MVNMNMIVNTSDLVGYEAEKTASATLQRKAALAKLLKVWGKSQAKNAKKIGGFGMIAVSLAACNNDSDDTASADLAAQLAAANAAVAAAQAAQAAAEAAAATATTSAAAEAVAAAAVTELTTGIDTVIADNGNGSLSAGISGTTQTWQSLDVIDMGTGTDTFQAIISGSVTPQMTGVENLVVSSTANTPVVDLSATSGTTNVTNSGSTVAMSFTNMTMGTDVSIQNVNNDATTLSYQVATGTADSANISISNAVGGSGITLPAIETINLTTAGSVANSVTLTIANTNTLNISGAASLTLGGTNTTSEVIDASGSSGAVIMTTANTAATTYTGSSSIDTLTAGTAAAIETISLGAGNDKVTFTANLDVTDVLTGGDGTDTLVGVDGDIRATVGALRTTNLNISEFETLTVSDALTATLTTAQVQATGITQVNLGAGGTGGVTMAAGDMTVTLTDALTGLLTLIDTGTGTTDTMMLKSSSVDSEDLYNDNSITVTGYETFTLDTTVTGAANIANVNIVTMNPDVGADATMKIIGSNQYVGKTTTGAIKADIIDASGMTAQAVGTTTFDMNSVAPVLSVNGAATAHIITGSPGDDAIISAANAATMSGGLGNDDINGGAGNDTLNGGDGNDTLDGGNGADTINGGAGNDLINTTVAPAAAIHTIDAGAGDDTVNMDSTLATTDTVAGGEGTDTLRVDAAVTAATAANVTGFEVLQIDSAATQSMAEFTSSNAFTALTANNTGTTAVTNAPSTLATLNIAAAGTTTFARLTDGTDMSLAIKSTAAGALTATAITAGDEETLTISSGNTTAKDFTITTLTAGDLTTLNLNGTGDVIITNAIVGSSKLATVDASGVTGVATVLGTASVVNMTATASTGVFTMRSGNGDDTINGGVAADNMSGGAGVDTMNGLGAGDTLHGQQGADIINGGGGADSINGGTGNDTLTGGAGVDDFTLTAGGGVDTITDFVVGTDTLSIATADANLAAGGENAGKLMDANASGNVIILAPQAAVTITDNNIHYISMNGAAANLTTSGTAVMTTADLTATTLTNLATYLNEQYTSVNGDEAMLAVNWTASGTNSYIYELDSSGTAVIAADLTLVAIVDRVTTILTSGDLIT